MYRYSGARRTASRAAETSGRDDILYSVRAVLGSRQQENVHFHQICHSLFCPVDLHDSGVLWNRSCTLEERHSRTQLWVHVYGHIVHVAFKKHRVRSWLQFCSARLSPEICTRSARSWMQFCSPRGYTLKYSRCTHVFTQLESAFLYSSLL